MQRKDFRVLSWFSCGAASAVATKLALQKYKCEVIYCDTGSEHPDNKRFLNDVAEWLGCKVIILKSKKYNDIWDVFDKTRYLAGIKGARCTTELKKKLRLDYQRADDLHIFGYTVEEKHRVKRLANNSPELYLEFPLVDNQLSKQDCLALIEEQGIELPVMYKLGYRNNNCIGCVKGQAGYWNKIRVDFPEVFERMAKTERVLNVALNKSYAGDKKRKRIFLDELPKDMGKYKTELDIDCGLMCQITAEKING